MNSLDRAVETQLILDAQGLDTRLRDRAVARLVKQYTPFVYSLIGKMKLCLDISDAFTAGIEAIYKAAQGLTFLKEPRFVPTSSTKSRGNLLELHRNQAIRFQRMSNVRDRMKDQIVSDFIWEEDLSEESISICDIISSLNPEDFELVSYRLQSYSWEEVGTLVGKSAEAARKKVWTNLVLHP